MSDIDSRVYGYEPAQSQLNMLRRRIERLRAVINPLKPCKDCNGSGSESNMWRDKKNGCGRCNGYGWVLTGNRDNFREAIAAARRALDGEEVSDADAK